MYCQINHHSSLLFSSARSHQRVEALLYQRMVGTGEFLAFENYDGLLRYLESYVSLKIKDI